MVHTGDSLGDFSPPGKCDGMNDMQKTSNCCTSEKRLYTFVCEFICILQKHKIADKIAKCERGFNRIPTITVLTEGSCLKRELSFRFHIERLYVDKFSTKPKV
jgi:hypothetical protein